MEVSKMLTLICDDCNDNIPINGLPRYKILCFNCSIDHIEDLEKQIVSLQDDIEKLEEKVDNAKGALTG